MRSISAIQLAVLSLLLGSCVFDSSGLRFAAHPPDGQPSADSVVVDGGTWYAADLSAMSEQMTDLSLSDDLTGPVVDCPAGLARCGSACVDLEIDFDHCGQCDHRCDSAVADACLARQCVCGTGGAPCAAGLNCIYGTCTCLEGGACTGCCDVGSGLCIPKGTDQSTAQCGTGGAPCTTCDDDNACTEEICHPDGQCSSQPKSNGTACDDGQYCTVGETCNNGTCGSAALRDCSFKSSECADGICSETFNACVAKPKPTGIPCSDGVCCMSLCLDDPPWWCKTDHDH